MLDRFKKRRFRLQEESSLFYNSSYNITGLGEVIFNGMVHKFFKHNDDSRREELKKIIESLELEDMMEDE